jgi:tetratricopeptide (TPR) repeat protein
MGVDERNDHSFRIPRPDLAAQLDMPDACTNCHTDKNSPWAADVIKQWYGKTPQGYQKFGKALHALEQQDEQALTLAYSVLLDDSPTIAKATALGYLGAYPSRQTLMTSLQMLRSKQADIRRQALLALQGFPLQHTVAQIFPLLNDPVKLVRLEAASILAAMPRGSLQKEQATLMDKVTEEYRQSLLFSADRPESQLALAHLYRQQGLIAQAESSYKQALVLQPKYVPAYVNYANFLQQQNREPAAFAILQHGLNEIKNAALYHSLGLWYVRNKDKDKGIALLQKAAEMEPHNTRYLYVYAVAIGETQPEKAIELLEVSLEKHSGNIDVLIALASYYNQLENESAALT